MLDYRKKSTGILKHFFILHHLKSLLYCSISFYYVQVVARTVCLWAFLRKCWRFSVLQDTLGSYYHPPILIKCCLFRTTSLCNTSCFRMGFVKRHTLKVAREIQCQLLICQKNGVRGSCTHFMYQVFHISLIKNLSLYDG